MKTEYILYGKYACDNKNLRFEINNQESNYSAIIVSGWDRYIHINSIYYN